MQTIELDRADWKKVCYICAQEGDFTEYDKIGWHLKKHFEGKKDEVWKSYYKYIYSGREPECSLDTCTKPVEFSRKIGVHQFCSCSCSSAQSARNRDDLRDIKLQEMEPEECQKYYLRCAQTPTGSQEFRYVYIIQKHDCIKLGAASCIDRRYRSLVGEGDVMEYLEVDNATLLEYSVKSQMHYTELMNFCRPFDNKVKYWTETFKLEHYSKIKELFNLEDWRVHED